jgi:hypothetical protein
MDHLSDFPPLPPASSLDQPWSVNVTNAHRVLSESYTRACRVLFQESDALQVKFHIDTLANDMVPILEAMEHAASEEGIPQNWMMSAATALGSLVVSLRIMLDSLDGRFGSQ